MSNDVASSRGLCGEPENVGVCLCAEDVLSALSVPILSLFVNVIVNLYVCVCVSLSSGL